MASNGVTQRRAHLLMLPLEESGHFNPFVQLLYYLSRYEIRVTFCSTKKRIGELAELKSKGAFKDLDLRLEDIFFESDEAIRQKDLPPLFVVTSGMEAQFKPYVARVMGERDPDAKPTFMLADFLLNWAQEYADKLGIQRYMFSICPSWAPLSVLWGNEEDWISKQDDFVTMPGMSPIRIKGNMCVEFAPMMDFKNAAGLLCQTFEELEPGLIAAVRDHFQKYPTTCGQVTKFLPIGPTILLPGNIESLPDQRYSMGSLKWLDSQAASSVLYIAFGSQAKLGEETIHEIAYALESTNVPFLWALNLPAETELSSVLPPGFLERTKDKGLMETQFAAQWKILSHPSTRAFLSHCGWNSGMESLCAGVPIVGHPMHGDQPTNSRVLAEVMKTAIIIPKIKEGVSAREDISKSIKSVMLGEEGVQLKKHCEFMKKTALTTQEEGGSSNINLRMFMQEVLASAFAK